MTDFGWSPHCPRTERCAACGSDGDLGVETFNGSEGIFCVTLCERCSDHDGVIDWQDTRDKVIEHCRHVGVSIEEMAVLLAAARVVRDEVDRLRAWPWL